MVQAHALGRSDEHFQRCITCAGAHTGEAGIDAIAAVFKRNQAVGHAEAEVVMGMHAGLGCRVEHVLEGLEALGNVPHVHRPARVHHVDALCTVAFHQLALRGESGGGLHVAHHEETDGVHTQRTGVFDVLAGYVGFGTVGGDAHDARACVVGSLEVVHGADPWQQKRGNAGALDHRRRRIDPLKIGVCAKAVVETRTLQAIAVRNFNAVYAGVVQRLGDPCNLFEAVAVTHGMHTVAQGDVGNVDFSILVDHFPTPSAASCAWAIRSATVNAALVMMSRLPANAGR